MLRCISSAALPFSDEFLFGYSGYELLQVERLEVGYIFEFLVPK